MKTKLLLGAFFFAQLALAQTYNNGGLATGTTAKNGTAAPAGYQWSELQNNAGNTTESNTNLGFGVFNIDGSSSIFLADDFVVPAGQTWNITSISTFAYFTGYTGTTSPIASMTVNIYSSNPSVAGAASVFGNDTSNVMSSSTDAMMYRVGNTMYPTPTTPGTTRKIWKNTASIATTLSAGTYWLKWQHTNVTPTSGGFAPPVTIVDTRGLPTWNALQYTATTDTWAPVVDSGNPAAAPDVPMDMPFIITYTTSLNTKETLQYDNRVVVYPNPAKESFRLQLPPESDHKGTTVQVLDMSGRVVKTMPHGETYNVQDLSKGAYMLRINDGKNIKVTRLIKE